MSSINISMLIFGTTMALFVIMGRIRQAFLRDDAPLEEEGQYIGERYAPFIHPMTVTAAGPFMVLFTFVLGAFLHIPGFAADTLFWYFSIMFQIGLYDMLLLALMPILRKRISPRGITVLWILPNAMYFTYHLRSYYIPSVVIPVNERIGYVIFAVWAAGALVMMARYSISHLRFRNIILSGAIPLSPEAEAVLREEEKKIGIKKPFRAVISDRVRTPLSIGLWKKSKCIVLPVHNYTERELSLIFRHELIHLRREDCAAKMFLSFSAAISWWNPLVRIAMQKNAEDMELACDQMALAEADDATRKEYAELLLTTSGDHRGFTTCLSANATSLHYRLRAVLHPVKKKDGIFLAAILFILLFLTCGQVGFAYGEQTVSDAIAELTEDSFGDFDSVTYYSTGETGSRTEHIQEKEVLEKLSAYLSSCKVYETTGEIDYLESGISLDLICSDRIVSVEAEDLEGNPFKQEFRDEVTLQLNRHSVLMNHTATGKDAKYYMRDIDLEHLREILEGH